MRRALALLLLLLVAVQLAPFAGADHVYSHRYLVLGRVVDPSGHPVPGVEVSLDVGDLRHEGSCAPREGSQMGPLGLARTAPQTNDHGEFMFCVHAHEIRRETPRNLTVRLLDGSNTTALVRVDPDFRQSFVVLTTTAMQGTPMPGDYTVMGRLWREVPNGTGLEGVHVYGRTMGFVPVNVTLEHDGRVETANATANLYGDFVLRLNLTRPALGGVLTVEALGVRFQSAADPAGFSYVRGDLDRPTTLAATASPPQAPGAGPLLALAALAGVALLARQKRGGA